jgi:hypothetical protein
LRLFLFGIVLMPLFGPTGAMLAICMGYLMLLPNLRGKGIRPIAGFVVGVGLYLAIFGHFDFNDPVPGEEVVIVRHGVMADVAVVRDARQAYHLKVNNH